MAGSVPLSSPVATSWTTMLGNSPVRVSVSAMVPPSRTCAVASVSASSMTRLPLTRETVSIASMSGMPLVRSTDSVRHVRAMIALRTSGPNSGTRSFAPSMSRRPRRVCSAQVEERRRGHHARDDHQRVARGPRR